MIQINKTDLKTAIQWALGSIGIWTPEIERELIIEITNLALSQHDVIKNEVVVCPECGCNKVQKLAGDNYSCMNAYCEWQTVL